MKPAHSIVKPNAGFGLGLRTPHYAEFLAAAQPLDWLEIITDNFLVEGGKPLVMLDAIRRDYPLAMHGVAMSVGAAGGVDAGYLKKVKALADRIEPLWVSDHLCWTGPGPEQLHDLYPLPYTDEAARHVVAQIRFAQDVLQRRLVLENVSSYIDFKERAASEWQFLSYVAEAADCLLLVDVNNIYVSSVNHRFDPLHYLNALPASRVQQIHIAGHCDHGHYIVDTHDHPVAPAVWNLYAHACSRFGPVATMIERDDDIPPLQVLLDELALAKGIAAQAATMPHHPMEVVNSAQTGRSVSLSANAGDESIPSFLGNMQRRLGDYILDRQSAAPSECAASFVRPVPDIDTDQRLGIYYHAYRARLVEVLADSFAKTRLYMGSDAFEQDAMAFAVRQPPMTRSLNLYGDALPDYLAGRYPDNPELRELAQLDWDLRTRFDSADAPALTVLMARAGTSSLAPSWLMEAAPLHHTLLLRHITTNVVSIWRAIEADAEVPEVQSLSVAKCLVVWRQALRPHFRTLEGDEAAFLQRLVAGHSIDETAHLLAGSHALSDPQRLGAWLQAWLADGILRVPAQLSGAQ